jgi:hypothetical protein
MGTRLSLSARPAHHQYYDVQNILCTDTLDAQQLICNVKHIKALISSCLQNIDMNTVFNKYTAWY